MRCLLTGLSPPDLAAGESFLCTGRSAGVGVGPGVGSALLEDSELPQPLT